MWHFEIHTLRRSAIDAQDSGSPARRKSSMCWSVAVFIRDEFAVDELVDVAREAAANRGLSGTNVLGFDFGLGTMKLGVDAAFGLGCIKRGFGGSLAGRGILRVEKELRT